MKIECIKHPVATEETGYFFTQLRREYWEVCEPAGKIATTTRACAAKLLHYFENWMNSLLASKINTKAKREALKLGGHPDEHDNELWVFGQSAKKLAEILMEHNEKTIKQALNWLTETGYLYRRENPGTAFDRCYQYQINVALVQDKLDRSSQESLTEDAETRSGNHSSISTTIVPLEPSSYQWDEHIKDLPYRSEFKDLKEINDEECKGLSPESPTRDSVSEFFDFANQINSTSGEDKPNPNPITTESDQNHTPGQNSDLVGEDVYSASPKFYTEKINNRIWQFSTKTDRVQMPGGSKYKLARAVTNKALQLWLADLINSEADEEVSLAVDDSGAVWMYDSRMGYWMDEEDMHSIAKLISIAEFQECFDLDAYNKKAIELFEQIEQAINKIGTSIKNISVANIAEFIGLELPHRGEVA